MAVSHKSFEILSMGLGDERWALIERIASSRHLKSSIRLREFLFYTADCAIREAPEDDSASAVVPMFLKA